MRMKRVLGQGASWLAILMLAACGGGSLNSTDDDGTGTDDPDGGGGQSVASLTLVADSSDLAADADTTAEGLIVTAIARDADNNVVADVDVSFAATSGELAVDSGGVTGSDGRATATLTTAGDPSLRTITLLADASGVQATLDVQVVAASSTNDPVLRLGTLEGDVFTTGQIEISQSPLSAGGSSGLELAIVDTANGNTLYTGEASVTFNSACIGNGLAEVDPNPASAFNGSVSATYVALGCSGEDQVSASASVEGQTLSATGVIEVLPASLGSIEFVSATPTTIGLQGSGQTETSTVVFQVRNSSGGPVANQLVDFVLNTSVGGIQLEPASGTTNSSGEVQTVVRSGTVHTAVRVTATATQGDITVSSQSEELLITTGLPDQDSFSVSAECFNVEGLLIDGTTSEISLLAADRFNNPISDGTAIAFTTEGGAVEGGCTTIDGACSVTWRSQDPRPAGLNGCTGTGGNAGSDAACSVDSANGASRPGRATVLVTALGEESFTDLNGNGRYDDGEPFDDLAEAFRDDDEDSSYDASFEEFADFNSNGTRDSADGLFNGVLCESADCAPAEQRTLNVRNSVTIIMSGSSPFIDTSAASADIADTLGSYDGDSFTVDQGGTFIVYFVIRDVNDQPMPAGTTIEVSLEGAASAIGTSQYTVACTTDDSANGNRYGFAIEASEIDPGEPNDTALLELRVTSPAGLETIYAFTVNVLAP